MERPCLVRRLRLWVLVLECKAVEEEPLLMRAKGQWLSERDHVRDALLSRGDGGT